jgi:hypothetical protein
LTAPYSYGHELQYHIWNTRSTGLTMAGSDNHNELNDPGVIGFWFDGTTDRSKVDLRESHSNFVGVLNNAPQNAGSAGGACNEVIAGQIDVDTAWAHLFEDDLGCLIFSHGDNYGASSALVADAASPMMLSLNRMPAVTLYYESDVAQANTMGDTTNVFNNGNFGSWCNSSSVVPGCFRQRLQTRGALNLTDPNGIPVWEYTAPANVVLQATKNNIAAVPFLSLVDLAANVNVVTSGGNAGGTNGVRLPSAASVIDFNGDTGSSGCIQIVNSQNFQIAIWAHTGDTVADGGVPVSGTSTIPLGAYKTVTFCPVKGSGWVGS